MQRQTDCRRGREHYADTLNEVTVDMAAGVCSCTKRATLSTSHEEPPKKEATIGGTEARPGKIQQEAVAEAEVPSEAPQNGQPEALKVHRDSSTTLTHPRQDTGKPGQCGQVDHHEYKRTQGQGMNHRHTTRKAK